MKNGQSDLESEEEDAYYETVKERKQSQSKKRKRLSTADNDSSMSYDALRFSTRNRSIKTYSDYPEDEFVDDEFVEYVEAAPVEGRLLQ